MPLPSSNPPSSNQSSSPFALNPSARVPAPTRLGYLPGLDLHARYHSARTGGDFFDALTAGSYLVFLLADIAGTRAIAHAIAAETQNTFRSHGSRLFHRPEVNAMDTIAELVHHINNSIIHASQGVHFAPTFLACYDLRLGLLTYINAGGQPAIFRDSDGTRLLGNVSLPLGLFTHLTYEPSIQAFEPGDCLLLVTKGVVEARHGATHLGVQRLTHLLQQTVQQPSGHLAAEICRATLQSSHQLRKDPWYSPHHLPFRKPHPVEDLTAISLVRSLPSTPTLFH